MIKYEATYVDALQSMQDIMMRQVIDLIESKKCLRIIEQSNAINRGVLRCTDKGSLNTLLSVKYDFQYDTATFVLKFNGNVIKTSDGSDDFNIHFDRNPDESFGALLDTINHTLDNY